VLDDHLMVLPHNPINDELSHLLLDRESRLLHGLPDTRAKSFDAFEEPEFCGPLGPLLLDFPHPLPQPPSMVVKPATSLRQVGQGNHCGLIGINEPRHFPLQAGELALQASACLCRADLYRGVPASVLILCPQHGWVRQQGLHVLPDTGLDQCRTAAAARACPRRIPRIAPGADITTALCTPRAHHTPATAPTNHQTPQQIWMLRVVALRALAIPGPLPLRPVPSLGIDERWHPDRNPCALGAPRAPLAITELAIFEPT
jgi:hypothetical protein